MPSDACILSLKKSGQPRKSPEIDALEIDAEPLFYARDPADTISAHRHRIESRVRHLQMTTGKRFRVRLGSKGEADGVLVFRVE